jgi:hypothetical protein
MFLGNCRRGCIVTRIVLFSIKRLNLHDTQNGRRKIGSPGGYDREEGYVYLKPISTISLTHSLTHSLTRSHTHSLSKHGIISTSAFKKKKKNPNNAYC